MIYQSTSKNIVSDNRGKEKMCIENLSDISIPENFDKYCATIFHKVSAKGVAELPYNYYNLHCHVMWSILSRCHCFVYKNNNGEIRVCPYFKGSEMYLYLSDPLEDITVIHTHNIETVTIDSSIIGTYRKNLLENITNEDLKKILEFTNQQLGISVTKKPEKIDINKCHLDFFTRFSYENSKKFHDDESAKVKNIIFYRILTMEEENSKWLLNIFRQSNLFSTWGNDFQFTLSKKLAYIREYIRLICDNLSSNIDDSISVIIKAADADELFDDDAKSFIFCLKRALIEYLDDKSIRLVDNQKIEFLTEILTRMLKAKTPNCNTVRL